MSDLFIFCRVSSDNMASVTAVDCVTRATDGSLSGPDLVLNFELCDIVNMDQRY